MTSNKSSLPHVDISYTFSFYICGSMQIMLKTNQGYVFAYSISIFTSLLLYHIDKMCMSIHILIYTGLEIERVIGTWGIQIASRDLKRVTACNKRPQVNSEEVPGTQLDFVIFKLQEKAAIKKQSDFNMKGPLHNILVLKYGVYFALGHHLRVQRSTIFVTFEYILYRYVLLGLLVFYMILLKHLEY